MATATPDTELDVEKIRSALGDVHYPGLARGLVSSPVTVITEAGPLHIEWRGDDAYLTGPAEIVAKGEFYL